MAKPVIAVTMGDPAGIGPEICLASRQRDELLESGTPLIFGSAALLRRVGEHCGLPAPDKVLPFQDFRERPRDGEPAIVDCGELDAAAVQPGRVDAACGRAAYQAIADAIDAAKRGLVDAVVTAPINKEALFAADIHFPGHTEIFAAHTDAARACMLLASEDICCSFVSTHNAYAKVPELASMQRILDVIELSHEALEKLRGRRPRIGVLGLNPHAGEHGLFGNEEQEAIVPAIEEARRRGLDVTGPLSPDAAFLPGERDKTDCFVCMYHDQGHIPFKMIAFDLGVNLTLGLPIIRASVDHGTAFDIAWQGKARIDSICSAWDYALRLAAGRAAGQGAG